MDGDHQTTIPTLFFQQVERRGDATAIWFRTDEQYQSASWNQLADEVRRAAAALIDVGVNPGDRVLHVSENRYEWIVTDLAIQTAGAVHVPAHASLTGAQIAYQLQHSGSRVVLLSSDEQAQKLASVAATLPNDVQYFTYTPSNTTINAAAVTTWSNQTAKAAPLNLPQASSLKLQASDDVSPAATILYTSGTTGDPKGVVLTQQNLVSNALDIPGSFGLTTGDVRFSFLPLSHIFARTCDVYAWIACGYELALAYSRESVIADCQQVKPVVMNGVPYFYDKVYQTILANGKADTPGEVRELLGGRIRVLCSGGAALPTHLYDFYLKQGTPILEGYGLTETSPVITLSTIKHFRRDAVGQVLPSVEVRIADDGEVLTRGPHVMPGYWKDDAATAEVIRDGWFYTGDLGNLDADGFLYITGRKKELIVTAGGKNISPVLLESLLSQDPLISQVMVIGDDRKCLSALIVPAMDQLRDELAARQIPVDDLCHPQVSALYRSILDCRLADVSRYEQIASFTLLQREFSVEKGELTLKSSLRRSVIAEHFSTEIEAMYS